MSSASIPNNIVLKKCGPFGGDLQIHIPNNSLYTYPDINIICGKIESYDKFDTATNPSVIIEILSASTHNYGKGEKFILYRDIESLQEYIVIDSEKISVEKLKRNTDQSWQLTEFKNILKHFLLDTLGIEIALEVVYEDVEF